MLGTCLRNQRNRNTGRPQRFKQSVGGTRHADHARTLKIHECDITNRRNALDVVGISRLGHDATARVRRVKAVSNDHRNGLLDDRSKRLRMDDTGAEIGKLHGLTVRELVDDLRLRHTPGIGTHYTVNVGPDAQLRGIA